MVKSKVNTDSLLKLLGELRDMMAAGNAPGCAAACQNLLSDKSISIEELYLDCLTPLLAGVGQEWQEESLPVWREHVVSAICRDIIGAMSPEISRIAAPTNGKIVVLACPPEEQHDLGLRMYADLYRLKGWQAYFLGADVPVREIIGAIQDTQAETVVLAAATHFNLINIDTVIEQIASSLADIEILLTGPAYKHGNAASSGAKLLDPRKIA